MRRLLLLALALALAGCSREDRSETPSPCSDRAETYLAALEDAPGEVRLDAETAISDCLTRGQEGTALGIAGQGMVAAATELNRRARSDPRDAVALGYLVGAVERGASRTGGIHADLGRRVEAAARFSSDRETFSAAFERAYARGLRAGRRSG